MSNDKSKRTADSPSNREIRLPPLPPPMGDTVYYNRELSWLAFDERVLAMSEDERLPLLERVKFLAIFASNLDEFFQVRAAGLKAQVDSGMNVVSADGLGPGEQLQLIHARVKELVRRASAHYHKALVPALGENGIRVAGLDDLDTAQQRVLRRTFEREIFPVLTPLAVDPAHPFPFISNLSLNLAVLLRDPTDKALRFARVKVPSLFPRLLVVEEGQTYVPLEDVIAAHMGMLFPGMEIASHSPFRVTRDADLDLEEEDAADLREAVVTGLERQRLESRAVRLEVDESTADEVLSLLRDELELDPHDTYFQPSPLDLGHLWALYDLPRPDLKAAPWHPRTPHVLARVGETSQGRSGSIFEVMRDADLLLHHPYDSFSSSVEAFIEQAADDPDVLAIKHTLYRTSGPETSVFRALMRAARAGKQVVTLVEVKARFDEQANIEWGRTLERAGVHVVYGLVGLKTHAKVTLVIRNEGGRIRRYCHVGTGNYHPVTARLYEDIGLLTASDDIGEDLSNLFNHLTGTSRAPVFRKLLVAPQSLRERLVELIHREMDAPDGHIVMKLNSLSDPDLIDELYDASRAGVEVDLIVRGICCLKPGAPEFSEHIRVRSILGEFLEHSRIYRFGSEERGQDYWIGSADMMPRNLSRRVEALVPIEEPALKERLEQILEINLADDTHTWTLDSDGAWTPLETDKGICAQDRFKELAGQRAEGGRSE
ncbi:MAG: polyphosphate kinase 1 [Deltaproteobacteria bacterium]|nr:polyphosphate kinase 1 [Deltaproteobacteria bacterium]